MHRHHPTKSLAYLLLFWMMLLALSPARATASEASDQKPSKNLYVVTIHPLAAILERVVGQRGEVVQLLPPNSSPHTFEPKPSDAVLLGRAKALFIAGPNLDKEWTAGLPADHRIEMLHLVPSEFRLRMPRHLHHTAHARPEEPGSTLDPHFWTDPLTVKALLPALAKALSELDREGRQEYQLNAARFDAALTTLHLKVSKLLQPVQKQPIFMFHPSFQYLLKRYDLNLAGVIEPFPGQEPSPKSLHHLINTSRKLEIKALFTEPQLPKRPAKVIAEAAGLKIHELDPLGGGKGRETYEEILLYNARTLAEALTNAQQR